MSCHSELTYAIYLDGELPPGERRALESHLISCLPCRELVVALRGEAEALGDALQERPHAPHRQPETAHTPARGLALGLAPALLAAVLATSALGWLLDVAWPAVRTLIAPLAFGGIYDMAFDLFFLLRDEAPAALEVGVAVAAMASLSALLCFSLTVVLRRWSGPTLLGLGVVLAVGSMPGVGHAHFGLHEHHDYSLPAGEVHDGTLLAHGDTVTIDGVVDGDLIALTRWLVLRGEVRGNVIGVARDVEVSGAVTGSLIVAGRSGRIAGSVGGNLYGFGGESFALAPSGRVERDLVAAGDEVRVEGSVGRDVFAGGDAVEVRGQVGRNVHAWADSVSLQDGARVEGDVDAILPHGQEVDVAAGAVVNGATASRESEHGRNREGFALLADPGFWALMALHIGAGFAVGLALYGLLPGVFGARLATAGAFFRSLGLGFAAVVLPPLALALLALTLIGIPLALMGLFGWLIALYASFVVVSFLVGRSLVPPRDASWTAFGLALLAGLVVVVIVTHLPYLGGTLRVLTILTGIGLLAERMRGGWPALTQRPI